MGPNRSSVASDATPRRKHLKPRPSCVDPSRMWTYVLRHHEELRRIYALSQPDVR